jgi:uracil-DNA glycosylase
LQRLPNIELTLLVGGYAQKYYLGDGCAATMTETVHRWRAHAPRFIPLPHPSWRNTGWLKRNPWFSSELLPSLRERVRPLL